MSKVSWSTRAAYLKSLNNLKNAIDREMNAVQPGEELHPSLMFAMNNAMLCRRDYLDEFFMEEDVSHLRSVPPPAEGSERT